MITDTERLELIMSLIEWDHGAHGWTAPPGTKLKICLELDWVSPATFRDAIDEAIGRRKTIDEVTAPR